MNILPTITYERYHNSRKVSNQVIGKSNFTYINIVQTLQPLIMNGKMKILDIGCGVGSLSFFIASKGNDVVGIDISKNAINTALLSKEKIGLKNRVDFLCGELNIIKGKNKFDLILISEVLEHLPNDIDILRKIYSLLKHNGFLVLTTPSINAPLYKLGLLKEFDKNVGHLRRYSDKHLVNILTDLNFEILKVDKSEGFLRNILFTQRGFNWMIRFIKGYFAVWINLIDCFFVRLFGESQIIIIAKKIKR